MSQHVCRSKVQPCPAGERCPAYKQFLSTMASLPSARKTAVTSLKGTNLFAQFAKAPSFYTGTSKIAMPKTEDAIMLSKGIFLAASRTYGETYVEPAIRKLFGLTKPEHGDHDGFDEATGLKYEIKSAKVLLAKPAPDGEKPSLFDTIVAQGKADPLSRVISFNNRKTALFDANIQNVKRDHFDFLIYNLLFAEGISIHKVKTADINKDTIAAWSDKHGRYDVLGKSGQFNIKCGNIAEHEKNNAASFVTWDELVPIFKDMNENNSN